MMSSRLPVLWISHFVPYPPKGGAFQRSYNLLRQVARECEVHLFAIHHKPEFHPGVDEAAARAALGEFCRSVDIAPLGAVRSRTGFLRRALGSAINGRSLTVGLYDEQALTDSLSAFASRADYDIVHADCISVAPMAERVAGDAPVVLNHHGAEGWMMRRRVQREPSWLRRRVFSLEATRLLAEEREYVGRVACNTVCSAFDGELLGEDAPGARFEVVPNGVDVEFFRIDRAPAAPGRVVFAGRLDQYSNRDGILWFCDEVWPRVRAACPDATLDVLGNNPPGALREAPAGSGIEVHGFVDDIRPWFTRASAAITPIRDGGGTRIKVLDAMSMGMPVVATSVALEGLDVTPDSDLLVADSAEAYADAVIRLLKEPEQGEALGAQARRTVEARYAWPAIGHKLVGIYRELAAAGESAAATDSAAG